MASYSQLLHRDRIKVRNDVTVDIMLFENRVESTKLESKSSMLSALYFLAEVP